MNELLAFFREEYTRKFDCKLRSLLAVHSIPKIVNELIGWLNDGRSDYFDVTTFARDFYIGSDLTQEEKKTFYNELKKQGFFEKLNEFLYSNAFPICSWTIYTFGKFSEEENSVYLEKAYETRFRYANPILAYRCLSELDWLGSKMIEHYLVELTTEKSIISKLVLLFYWECRSYDKAVEDLINDRELVGFLAPKLGSVDMEEVSGRLFAFENHISEIYSTSHRAMVDQKDFLKIAADFFRNYSANTDPQAEIDHQNFLDHFDGH